MTLGYTIHQRELMTNIYADVFKSEIPEDLRRRIAQNFDDQLMRLAFGGPPPAPTTLYVDKHGRYSTVDPNAPQHTYYRPGFGLVVSS